jgi:Ca2+-binding RTX toxin-like protein
MATAGDDIINISQIDVATLNALAGVDTLVATTAIKNLNMATAQAEVFRGSNTLLIDNDDIVTAVGSAVAVKLYGFLGNDTLTGSSWADLLDGGVGIDVLSGGDGNDTLIGGAGADFLYGGDGDDVIYFDLDDLLNGVVDAGAGLGDRGILQGTAAVTILDLDALGLEHLTLSSGSDSVTVLASSTLAHTILGMGGNDTLYGGSGADTIDGGADNDRIEGGEGADRLAGGVGNDTIYGGAGADNLAGGAGTDHLDGGDGNDVISFDVDDLLLGTVNGGTGSDTATLTATTTGVTITDLAALEIERLTLSNGADSVGIAAGDVTGRFISGMGGADTLLGGDGKDTLTAVPTPIAFPAAAMTTISPAALVTTSSTAEPAEIASMVGSITIAFSAAAKPTR